MIAILRKTLGVLLVVVGLFALVTPFTPGSWLALIGLELLGFTKQKELWARFKQKYWKERPESE